VILNATDTLKVTFQVVDKESGEGTQPHQTFLRFYDATTNEEGIQPIRVTQGGKANFELNMGRPPLSLPPTDDAPLQVTLYIGKPDFTPIAAELFDLHIPRSLPPPVHPDEASFHPLPEIHHTFRPDQKLPYKFVSAVFSGLVIAPWFLLIGLVRLPYFFPITFLLTESTHSFVVVPSFSSTHPFIFTQYSSFHPQSRRLRSSHILLLG
jgi:oligosaccharyltransferase complex subunit delta (ribophorin II)